MDGRLPNQAPSPGRFDFSARSRARNEQTERNLTELRRSIELWLSEKNKEDKELRRHKTQLGAIESVLMGVADVLSAHLAASREGSVSGTYDRCRQLTQATVGLERLWDYLRSRFDQRVGVSETAQTLCAADEVIWSCYRQVMTALPENHAARQRALMPLAYFAAEYSPAAAVFDQPLPPTLRFKSGNPTLDKCLDKLPMPTLMLPPWCVAAPWSLVLIAHEVGHHVQHELNLVTHFAEGLAAAARKVKSDEAFETLWARWGQEIFADAFSILAVGTPAAIAITELEWSDDQRLVRQKEYYPAPVIRLALMTCLAKKVGLDTTDIVPLEELEQLAASDELTSEDWKVVEPAVDFILSDLPDGLPSLRQLCAFDPKPFADRGDLAVWAEALRGKGNLDPRQGTESARHMVSSAISAWLATVAEADTAVRSEKLLALKKTVPKAINACAEQVVRAGNERAAATADDLNLIADTLLQASPTELPGSLP